MQHFSRGQAVEIALRHHGERIVATWDPVRQGYYKADGTLVPCFSVPGAICQGLMTEDEGEQYVAAYAEAKRKVQSAA